MNIFDFKEPEKEKIKTEKDFQEFIKKRIENILKRDNFEFIIIENFGLDLAIFIQKNSKVLVKFLELKVYKSTSGRIGFGNQRGQGIQVEILKLDRNKLRLLEPYVRWLFIDLEEFKDSLKRFAIIDSVIAKECVYEEVREGKQNNFNINKIKNYATGWYNFLEKIVDFMLKI